MKNPYRCLSEKVLYTDFYYFDMRERRILITFLLAIILITLPYIAAFAGQGEDNIFTGFLVNPFDGNSYLAKMMEGFQGRWTFTLPFSQDPGEGEYIFLFYLFLGHLARITGIPLIYNLSCKSNPCLYFSLFCLSTIPSAIFSIQ